MSATASRRNLLRSMSVFVSRHCCIEVLNRKHWSQFAKTENFSFGSAAIGAFYYLENWGPSAGGSVWEPSAIFQKVFIALLQFLDVKQCAWAGRCQLSVEGGPL